MEQEKDFDPKTAEASEINQHLLDNGMVLRVPRTSIFKNWGKSEVAFLIKQPYLGTLDYLSREYLALKFSEEEFQADPDAQIKQMANRTARHCARIVAIAILRGKNRIQLFTPLLAWYLYWHVTPAKLYFAVETIHKMSNYKDFINSIRSLSIQPRTTSPALMEKKQQGERVQD